MRVFLTMVTTVLMAAVLIACGGSTTPTGSSAQPTAASVSEPTASAGGAATLPTAAPAAATAAADTTTAPAAAATAPAAATTAAAPAATTNTKLNLNEATDQEFMSAIPNMGSRMVREFLEYRPYVSIQQFRKEIGKYVSAEEVAAYEQYVYVPVDVDQADAATLQQLPGVDATIADALIAGRPYGSNQAFLTKLAESVPSADLTLVESYLAAK